MTTTGRRTTMDNAATYVLAFTVWCSAFYVAVAVYDVAKAIRERKDK